MRETQTSDSIDQAAVEALESRLLMSSVINVSPGSQNDTSTIQNALNNAGGGGTVNLGAGQYHVSSQLTVPSGVTLEGNKNATLNWTGGTSFLLYSPWNSSGTKIDGVTLNGAGYKADPGGNNITFSNNTIENVTNNDPYIGNGIYMPDTESNSSFTGNTFYNINGTGIYYFDSINTQITNNSFNKVGEGIKGQWFNSGSNDVISNNSFNQVVRFGIECQGDPVNFTVSGNTLGNWQYRDSHIGLSIATGEGNGINITNNVIMGTGISNPNTAYTAIEAMGNNLTITGNYAVGWGWGELVGYTNHWVTENNTWGVVDTDWVLENNGTKPAVDSNNVNVSPTNFSGAPSTPVTSTPTATTTTTTPVATPANPTPTTTTSTPTSSGSTSLPSGWTDSDIGGTGISGSAKYYNGVYTVAGAGADVWGTTDSFNFAYQSVSGNQTITARVTSAQKTAQYSKAGIMIRSSLSNSASNVYLYQQADGRIIMTVRGSNGASTNWPGSGSASAPVWLKLVTSGNSVTGYYSTNGSTWNSVGAASIAMSSTNYAGLAVCAQSTSTAEVATFDNVSV